VNVLQYHQQLLVNLIHAQMQAHFVESATEYDVHVTKGFHTLRPNTYTADPNEHGRDFRALIPDGERHRIGTMLFGGFQKCLYPLQKFDSDPERRFAVILENDEQVLKWFKPTKGDLQIHYRSEASYEPDFVVETHTGRFLCEPKRASEMNDPDVLAKAEAAAIWCQHASDHARESDGKPWTYLLIPHDQMFEPMTVAGFTARYTYMPSVSLS
jgi:type III restriction enzyme